MNEKYRLARSLCDALGWDAGALDAAANGAAVAEVDERCRELSLDGDRKREALELANVMANAVAERPRTDVRLLASQPRLVPSADRIWAIGQEWLELVRRASRRIVVVSPSLDAIAASYLRPSLSAAFHAGTGLSVVHGVLGRADRLREAVSVFREAFPNADVLEWPSELGFLHAKMICVDATTVYLGSANVTEHGWNKNVEVGVTLRGEGALQLIRYCEGIVEIARSHAITKRARAPRSSNRSTAG